MNFKIMSYEKALEFRPEPGKYNVMIRVVNPKRQFEELVHRELFNDILELKFLDYTEEQVRNGETWPEDFDEETGYKLFSPEDAKSVVDFFDKHKDCDLMAIHCHVGKSRSAALGVGWCLFREDTDGEAYIRTSGEYFPNPDIISVLAEALCRQG